MRLLFVIPMLLALAGCAELGMGGMGPAPAMIEKAPTSAPAAVTTPEATATAAVIAPAGTSVAALDTTSAAEKQAAAAKGAAGGGAKLGRTTASLGDATEGGLWLRTSLVTAPTKGRIVDPATGKGAAVDLLPLPSGGGSRISLAAMTVLGLGPTDLPELDVFRG